MIYGLLFSGAIRSAALLAMGLAVCTLLSRSAAATRRFILVLTLGGAILVPIAAAMGPRWTVAAPLALSVLAHESLRESAPSNDLVGEATPRSPGLSPRISPSSPLAELSTSGTLSLAWLVVAAALLARTAASQLRVRGLLRRAVAVRGTAWGVAVKEAASAVPVEVRASCELDSPAVAGLFRPTIVVPHTGLDWSLERCRLVLSHELAHIRRRDVLAQAIADVACALHWFNPLVWLCARRLRVEREVAADDAVLAAGFQPSRYAEELLAVATAVAMPSAALAIAERASLEARVASILALRLRRAPLAARGTAAIVATGAAIAAAAACTSPEVLASPRPKEPAAASLLGTANDPPIQLAVDEEIATVVAEWAPELATIVVLDPATGQILGNAGRAGGKAVDVASTLAMPPGSTWKPITIAAALEERAITIDQKLDCGPSPRSYGDKKLRDSSANGTLDVAHLLAVSSNIGMSRIFDALGGDKLGLWAHRFHFGEAPGVPGSNAGVVPAQIVTGTFEGANVAIGEGLTATPLQMIAAYGAFADDGVYHAPRLDRGERAGARLVSPATASSIRTLLEAAVMDETATGKAARVDGIRVGGKTGTAQWMGPDGREETYASFIGIADLPSRRVVILVGVQAPRADLYGGKAAAPVFARLVKRIRAA